jgi:hypothetical protein
MNLPFFKLRLAAHPWILFDRTKDRLMEANSAGEPDWSTVAADICSRVRGASAEGLIVVKREGGLNLVETWDTSGKTCPPSPTALLCASRWLFDAGMAGSDSVLMRSSYGDFDTIVIDSRNFGMAMGLPKGTDGKPLDALAVPAGFGTSLADGRGIVVPLGMDGRGIEVTLRDRPARSGAPMARNRGGKMADGVDRVEALVVARHELRTRSGALDPVYSAAAVLAAAVVADFGDREVTVVDGREHLAAQWPEGESVFVAGAPSYCISGEFWAPGS